MRIHFEERGKKEIFVGLSDILQGENYSRHFRVKQNFEGRDISSPMIARSYSS